MRTLGLVGAGSSMFTALGLLPQFAGHTDPTRIAAQIVTGVGFLGAGSILRQGEYVRGLTTAASIWVVASLGMAIGFGYYGVAIFTAAIVLITLIAIRPIENRFFKESHHRRSTDVHPDEITGR